MPRSVLRESLTLEVLPKRVSRSGENEHGRRSNHDLLVSRVQPVAPALAVSHSRLPTFATVRSFSLQ
jgi:hypothetical protein